MPRAGRTCRVAWNVAIAIACFALIATACGRPPRSTRPSAPAPAEGTSGPPGITITSPRGGTTIRAGDLTVSFAVRGLKLVAADAASGDDDDHVDVFLDGDVSKYLNGDVPVPASSDRIAHSADTSVTFKSVAPGPHVITVLVTSRAHKAVKPRIWDSVSVLAQ